jgi:hypothetical protein
VDFDEEKILMKDFVEKMLDALKVAVVHYFE